MAIRPPSIPFLGGFFLSLSTLTSQACASRRLASITLICRSTSRVSAKGLFARFSKRSRSLVAALTSAQANRVLIQGGARRDKRKQKVDQTAAAILLQSYLDGGAH